MSLGKQGLPLVAVAIALLVSTQGAAQPCVGDCDRDGRVGIDELVTGVNIALSTDTLASCTGFDANLDGGLQINELIGGVRSSVEGGCDFVAEESDFECLTDWTKVRRFRIANPLGYLDQALAVANGEMPPPYPVGTIIQLIPLEAMVKRGNGFFPEANDWEFFVLANSPAGTMISKRGRGEVASFGTSTCFGCHNAAPQKDLICESGNGCIPLNLSEDLINLLQDNDPRCTP